MAPGSSLIDSTIPITIGVPTHSITTMSSVVRKPGGLIRGAGRSIRLPHAPHRWASPGFSSPQAPQTRRRSLMAHHLFLDEVPTRKAPHQADPTNARHVRDPDSEPSPVPAKTPAPMRLLVNSIIKPAINPTKKYTAYSKRVPNKIPNRKLFTGMAPLSGSCLPDSPRNSAIVNVIATNAGVPSHRSTTVNMVLTNDPLTPSELPTSERPQLGHFLPIQSTGISDLQPPHTGRRSLMPHSHDGGTRAAGRRHTKLPCAACTRARRTPARRLCTATAPA